MKPFISLNFPNTIFIFLGTLSFLSPVAFSLSPDDYGREMVIRVHQGMCWSEFLNVFPSTKTDEFINCHIQSPNVLKQVKEQSLPNSYFGKWMIQLAMGRLPKPYQECNEFLQDADKAPTSSYDDVLLESTSGKYPFRGFVHCMVNVLEATQGKDAVAALKKKITEPDHWRTVIFDRENQFRQRHSADNLKLAKQLNEQAQKWADIIAKECNPRHSKGSDPDRQFSGERTGESLAMSSADTVPVEDTAMVAVNGWYEEIKDYPFPKGYTGNGGDTLFPKIGHFTQTVWKETEYVGYGYASNDKCPSFKTYVVARYFPAGNMIGEFPENVLPPKNK